MRTVLILSILAFGSSVIAKRVRCADFDTQKKAQEYYQAKKRGWKSLDRDHDGEACECLPGGSGYDKSICRRWREKYGK